MRLDSGVHVASIAKTEIEEESEDTHENGENSETTGAEDIPVNAEE